MTRTFYKDYTDTLAPTVLRGVVSGPKVQAYGQLIDEQDERTIEAVKARMPELAPSDALPHIENERLLDRGLLETDQAYATRLKKAWERWPFAGSARAVLNALVDIGYDYSKMYLVQENGLIWQVDGSGTATPTAIPDPFSKWTFDSESFYTRFAILFDGLPALWAVNATAVFDGTITEAVANWTPRNFLNTDYLLSFSVITAGPIPTITVSNKQTGTIQVNASAPFVGQVQLLGWDDPTIWPLSNPGAAELAKLCRVIKRWKEAKSILQYFLVRQSGPIWGFPGQEWGDPGLVWGDAVTYKYLTDCGG